MVRRTIGDAAGGRYAATRRAPDAAGADAGPATEREPDAAGRIGVTFGYMNWWLIMPSKTPFPGAHLCDSSPSPGNLHPLRGFVLQCARVPRTDHRGVGTGPCAGGGVASATARAS
jgi:hypothetical protein